MKKGFINQTIYRNVTYLYMHVCKCHTCHGIRITTTTCVYMFNIISINSNFNINYNFTIISTIVLNESNTKNVCQALW